MGNGLVHERLGLDRRSYCCGGVVDFTPAALATSSAEQPERAPRKGVDGDEKTRWAGDNARPGHWLQLELSEPRRVATCRIVWEFPDRTYLYKLEARRMASVGKCWSTRHNKDVPAVKN